MIRIIKILWNQRYLMKLENNLIKMKTVIPKNQIKS